MQLWLNDPNNIEKLQALKNERREANKRRRTQIDDIGKPLDSIYNYTNNYGSNSPNDMSSLGSQNSTNLNRSPYTGSSGAPAAKKARILFSDEQKEALRVAFSMDPYPSTATIEFLANELNLSVRTITNWFHNHRMRLKQVSTTSAGSEDSGGPTQAPYNLGRDGVNFDPIHFRMLLSQRLSELRLLGGGHSSPSPNRGKYHSMYSTSPISSHIYNTNTNSCSSPDSSSAPEDDNEMETLDLSVTSHNKSNRSLPDDSDHGSDRTHDGDESVEPDLSKISRPIGNSRRKPLFVTSSSSRRKPAQPQWVAPVEFSGDEDEDAYADEGDYSDELEDDDTPVSPGRSEIINGVCVRQTD